jgi:hypothetical protein
MSNIKLSAKQIQDVAKTASVDVRTLLKYLAGERVRILAGERIRAALAAAGLLVMLLVLGCSDLTNAPRTPAVGCAGGSSGEVEPDAGAQVELDTMPAVPPDTRPDTSKPDARVLADTLPADTMPAAVGDTWPAMPGACTMQRVMLDSVGGGICQRSWTGTKIACKVGCQDFTTAARMDEQTPCLTVGKDAFKVKDAWTGPVVCLWSWDDCDRYCTTPIN